MATDITDHDEAGRYEVHVDGELAGYADRHRDAGSVVLPHTVVQPRFRGQDLAAALVRRALDDARAEGLTVVPACSYVADYVARHPEDQDLLADADGSRPGR